MAAEILLLAAFAVSVTFLWMPFENIDAPGEGYATAEQHRPSPSTTAAAAAAVLVLPVLVLARASTPSPARRLSRRLVAMLHVLGALALIAALL